MTRGGSRRSNPSSSASCSPTGPCPTSSPDGSISDLQPDGTRTLRLKDAVSPLTLASVRHYAARIGLRLSAPERTIRATLERLCKFQTAKWWALEGSHGGVRTDLRPASRESPFHTMAARLIFGQVRRLAADREGGPGGPAYGADGRRVGSSADVGGAGTGARGGTGAGSAGIPAASAAVGGGRVQVAEQLQKVRSMLLDTAIRAYEADERVSRLQAASVLPSVPDSVSARIAARRKESARHRRDTSAAINESTRTAAAQRGGVGMPAVIEEAERSRSPSAAASATKRWDVFVSFTNKDLPQVASSLQQQLELLGATVFNQKRDFADAPVSIEAMQAFVRQSRVVIALITPNYFASAACRAEVEAAAEAAIVVKPVHSGEDHPYKQVLDGLFHVLRPGAAPAVTWDLADDPGVGAAVRACFKRGENLLDVNNAPFRSQCTENVKSLHARLEREWRGEQGTRP